MRFFTHFKSQRLHLVIILIVGLLCLAVYVKTNDIKNLPQTGSTSPSSLLKQAFFTCQDNQTIDAKFYDGQVVLKLSDGRVKEAKQVVTSSGERYATSDDEFVFWTKGITSFIQEGQKTSFADCTETSFEPSSGTGIVTISGTILCLPHKNQTGPQTMECAYGLKADNNTYYGLIDSDPTYKNISSIPMNKKVEVTGIINLTTNSIYDTIGTLTVQSIKQL